MATERKCPQCKTWNGDETHCTSCGTLLDPSLIRAAREEAREDIVAAKAPDSLDKLYYRMRYSRWWLVRGVFWVVYSVWFVLFSILSFIIALIAMAPG